MTDLIKKDWSGDIKLLMNKSVLMPKSYSFDQVRDILDQAQQDWKKDLEDKVNDRNYITQYYGQVMAGQDNPMVSLKDVLKIIQQ